MPDNTSLRERIRKGESINIAGASLGTAKSELEAILSEDSYDMVVTDSQHAAFNEERLLEFCQNAKELGMPVQFRIKHTRNAYLIGNYLDLGPLAIVVPQVEDEATVDEAIAAFYYPPIGKRSWGPSGGYGFEPERDRVEYAQWWNRNGILSFQIESVDTVINARKLAKPGIAMLHWGANDLSFSLETYPNPPFSSVDDCMEHVRKQMEGTGIKVSTAYSPGGRL